MKVDPSILILPMSSPFGDTGAVYGFGSVPPMRSRSLALRLLHLVGSSLVGYITQLDLVPSRNASHLVAETHVLIVLGCKFTHNRKHASLHLPSLLC